MIQHHDKAHAEKPQSQSRSRAISLLLCACLAWPALGLGVQSDNQAPIEIQADSAKLSETAQTATYLGNVQLTQGTLQINCDELTIYNTQEGVERVEAKGSPATYTQMIDPAKPRLDASARKVTYMPATARIQLEGSARITQGGNIFEGQKIDYDLDAQVLMASSQPQTDKEVSEGERQRVKMTLQPQSAPPAQ